MKHISFIGLGSALFLSICLVISGCTEQTSSIPGKSSVPDTSISSTNSATDFSKMSKEYLKTNPAKGEPFNAAIKAYNEFLSGKTNAINKNTNKTININDMTKLSDGKPGIDSFALLDVNSDGLPELHTRAIAYLVFSYQDNQVVLWYESGHSLMDGNTYMLENGALFAYSANTGRSYDYTTFAPDGTPSTISFFDAATFDGQDVSENATYSFGGKDVTKKEYDNLTKEYIALSKKPASIEWHNYEQ